MLSVIAYPPESNALLSGFLMSTSAFNLKSYNGMGQVALGSGKGVAERLHQLPHNRERDLCVSELK
jgi:hypothetical protein